MKKLSLLTIISSIVGGVLMIWLLLSMFGVLNNFLAWDARNSGALGKVAAFILLAGVGFQVYRLLTLKTEGIGSVALIFVGIALAVAASTGFKSTAGDIKQRISYLNNLGKVVDTKVLFNCYEGFYHFNENPELKKYVLEYGELPGRNLWNSYILSGDEPKSNAPRADEDFKWHTGAYEMKIPKGCGN